MRRWKLLFGEICVQANDGLVFQASSQSDRLIVLDLEDFFLLSRFVS